MNNSNLNLILVLFVLLIPIIGFSQELAIRIQPPKQSKVNSIDNFSHHTFEVYNKVFVYDSLVNANVDIPAELEDEIAASIEKDVDSLSQSIPMMLDEVASAPVMRKLRAAGSLNKSRKAISFMLKTLKNHTLGESTPSDESGAVTNNDR